MIPYNDNRRQNNRVNSTLPVEISIGSQVTIQGRLKNLSDKSAFVEMRSSLFLQLNDELNFQIKYSLDDPDKSITGVARISRIAAGEGIAIYFTKLDTADAARLKELLNR